MSVITEYEIKAESRKIVLISGRGVLLQSKYLLSFLSFHKGESVIFELKKPGIKGIFNLESAAPDVLHINQYSLICVTVGDTSFFIDYDLKNYSRYPLIKHNNSPLQIGFVHPCYLCAFYQANFAIFLIYTGEVLETIPVSPLNFEVYCSSYNSYFISAFNSLISISSPPLDGLIGSLLIKKKYEIALEACLDTCNYLSNRVYFEYAVHMFFTEREYQRSAHYFRKSEEYWAVCSLLRKIVQIPAFAYNKSVEFFDKACEKISGYSILPSHIDFISQKKPLLYDSALKQRIIHNFIPFFTMIRKNDEELLRLFSECWLFSAFLYLPNQTNELIAVVRDPTNKLPLRFCEFQLKSFGKLDLLFELFLSRKIYKPALDLMLQKYSEEKSLY